MVKPSEGDPLVPGLVEIRTTFGDRADALACADRLVRMRLAACVQIDGPITSVYVWNGAVEQAEEWRCTCKTTRGAGHACAIAILADHPYQNPQVIVVPAEATPPYAAWVRRSVE